MHNFFAKSKKDNIVTFSNEDEKHILKVLRLKINDEINVNFNQKKYLAVINSIRPLTAMIIQPILVENKKYQINAFVSSIKPKYMEIAIQKATEIGVDNFYIFKSFFSQNNITHNLDRYNTIILNASKQSNRTDVMKIEIINNELILKKLLNDNDVNFIAHLEKNNENIELKESLKNKTKIGVLIGPEAGFNKNDLNVIKTNNTYIINLTNNILRSETALIYLLSIIVQTMKELNH